MESRFELQAVITGFATAAFPVAKKLAQKQAAQPWSNPVQQKGANQMRIAVTYENGNVFQHFGHTSQFKIYDIENGQVVNQQIVDTNGKAMVRSQASLLMQRWMFSSAAALGEGHRPPCGRLASGCLGEYPQRGQRGQRLSCRCAPI